VRHHETAKRSAFLSRRKESPEEISGSAPPRRPAGNPAGGKVPGSLPTDARQIFEEGIRVPPVKIYQNDQLQEDVLRLILHNCRLPHWNRSDFNAIVAAIRTAEKRVIEMAERFGDDVYYSALEELLDRNKRAKPQPPKRRAAKRADRRALAPARQNKLTLNQSH